MPLSTNLQHLLTIIPVVSTISFILGRIYAYGAPLSFIYYIVKLHGIGLVRSSLQTLSPLRHREHLPRHLLERR